MAETADVLNAIVGAAPGSAMAALRAQRPEILRHTQGSHNVLVSPDDPGGLSLAERALVVQRVAALSGHVALAAQYQALVFTLQLVILLSDPAHDFSGGEFVLVKQKPRTQSRAEVVTLRQGEAAIFAVHHHPARGVRGVYRVAMRHGVSTLREGQRFTLGVIFHDAA